MLSGALILSTSSKLPLIRFYKKRLPQFILLTVFYFTITNAFCIYLFDLQFNLKDYFYSLITFKPTFAYQLWYMYIIIILYLLAPFMARYLERVKTCNLIISFIIFSMTIFFPASIGFWGFHSLWNQFIPYIPYFLFGYLIFNRGIVKKVATIYLFLSFIISYLITLFMQIYLKKNGSFHGEGITWYTSPFILITGTTLFSLLSKLTINDRAYHFIKAVSLNSFGVYLIHLIPMFYMIKIMSNLNVSVIIKIIIIYFIVFLFSLIYTHTLSKIPFIRKLVV